MHRFREAKDQEGRITRGNFLHSEACRGRKLRGDEICPTGKAFDVVLTGDHGVRAAILTPKSQQNLMENYLRITSCPHPHFPTM
jgi:hypothetical protein